MKKLNQSFVAGAIALVFAVLGYQTALLVQFGATKAVSAGGNMQTADADSLTRDVSAPHAAYDPVGTKRTEKRRAALPRKVETFPFDPNTVSVEDLQRLGFSSKQAASIDAYRSKGGRFHRKEDFARSYVVSDSVYKRLEPFIGIPKLDINAADSAGFDALPGIGGYFARRMVEYRKQLHGYSRKEQLMEIYNFSEERFRALEDLICLGDADAYPLWTLPADSLRLHPYINSMSVARGIVFFRQHNPDSLCTVEALAGAGVISEENAAKLALCRIALP